MTDDFTPPVEVWCLVYIFVYNIGCVIPYDPTGPLDTGAIKNSVQVQAQSWLKLLWY